MTQEEFKQYQKLEKKFYGLCREYIEKRQTFDKDDYIIETDGNEWNFVDDYELWDDTVEFIVDTSGYKYEGKRYVITVPVSDILNDGNK